MKDQNENINPFAPFAKYFAPFAVKKKPLRRYILLMLFGFIAFSSFGQEVKLSEAIKNIAEELSADDSDPEAAATYIEKLQELAENPVRLNSSGENEISRLFFLSDFQVKALSDYAHSSGTIVTVFELANIPGFDRETVEMMIPFITLDNKNKISPDSTRGRSTLLTNICFKPGNNDTNSLGPSWKMLTKYKFNAGSFSGGITAEKDPGEKLLNGSPPLPDFLSANISWSGSGLIRRVIVGDYSARFGQGTNINSGIRTGLSLTAPGYMSGSNEIRPYTSTDENNFFRGVATELSFRELSISLFYSNKTSDATLGSSSGISDDYIENFYPSGLHNTGSLLSKKDAFSEQVYGAHLSYNFNNIRMGALWTENRFSLPVFPTAKDPQEVFNFTGDRNSLYTFYYNGFIKKVLVFGEFSESEHHKYALIQGMSLRPSDRVTINLLYRNYDAGYTSFHGNGTGSSSTSGNSQGLMGNFTFEAARHLFISGGSDIQIFPWLKYRNSSPSESVKQEVRVRFLPNEKLSMEGSFGYRLSEADSPSVEGIPEQKQIITRSLKGSVRFSLAENIIITTRIDYRIADPGCSRGTGLVQDLNYNFKKIPVTIWLRSCVFDTDTWDSRLYIYENDLLYSFSIPAFSGKGSRSYIMAKWEIGRFTELRVKYGITSRVENETKTDDSRELKIQLKMMF